MAPAIEGIDVHQRGENEPFFAWAGVVVGDRIDGVSNYSKSTFTITLDDPVPDSITASNAYESRVLSGSYPYIGNKSSVYNIWTIATSMRAGSFYGHADALMSFDFNTTNPNGNAMHAGVTLFRTYILVEFYFGSSMMNVTLDDVTFPLFIAVNIPPKTLMDEYNAKIEQDAS